MRVSELENPEKGLKLSCVGDVEGDGVRLRTRKPREGIETLPTLRRTLRSYSVSELENPEKGLKLYPTAYVRVIRARVSELENPEKGLKHGR